MSYYSTYRWCAVPECKNTSIKTKDKLWIQVPRDINMRKTWFKLAGRDPELISEKTRLYFCEDHFNLEHDMENYIQFKIMGSVKRIRLKPNCIPSRFDRNRNLKSASKESHLPEATDIITEAKSPRISLSKDPVQDLNEEDNFKASCIEDAQTAVDVPSVENKCDNAVQIIQVQEHLATQKDSSLTENEIKVFCPKCDAEVSHTAEGIQQDQTKLLIAKVYYYFEREYEELKTSYGDLDLTPLSKFRQRTALATGVSETTVLQILKEEEGRNAHKRQEPPETRRRARKRSRQTDSSCEENGSDDNDNVNEQSSNCHEAEMVEVNIEPLEYYNEEPEIYVPAAVKEQAQPDPISLDVKTEPPSDIVDETNKTLALNEPAGTQQRARKIPRSDVTSTRNTLIGGIEIKVEEIEIHEEGVG